MQLFIRYIVDKYHFTVIGSGQILRPSPARALEAARKIQCKALPGQDLQRIAHGIVTERTLNRAGIRFMNIAWYSTRLERPSDAGPYTRDGREALQGFDRAHPTGGR